jgi:hypothetical protein
MASDAGSPPVPRDDDRSPVGSPVEGLPDLRGFPAKEDLPAGKEPVRPAPDAIQCQAPPRPRALDCALLAVVIPCAGGWNLLLLAAMEGGPAAAEALDLPPAFGFLFGVGGLVGFGLVGALFMFAHATRYRAAHIDDQGIILGLLEPTPRGTWLKWRDVVGFRVGSGRIVLAVRGQPWTRWLGPIIECDDDLLHRVVVRLESKGVRRLDG